MGSDSASAPAKVYTTVTPAYHCALEAAYSGLLYLCVRGHEINDARLPNVLQYQRRGLQHVAMTATTKERKGTVEVPQLIDATRSTAIVVICRSNRCRRLRRSTPPVTLLRVFRVMRSSVFSFFFRPVSGAALTYVSEAHLMAASPCAKQACGLRSPCLHRLPTE